MRRLLAGLSVGLLLSGCGLLYDSNYGPMRSEVLAALNELEPPLGWVVLEEATATDPNERPLQEQGGSASVVWHGEPMSPAEARAVLDTHLLSLGFVRAQTHAGSFQVCNAAQFSQMWARHDIAVRIAYVPGGASVGTSWTADWRQTLEDVVPLDELSPCEE